ncbi:MAG TPA: TonB C-terminal domain-containing protein [Verrucomicrobiae bacterium]|nr:TonB C-terminal domain-containing protein [Verrucomicrobiae bacterium]
MNLLISFAFHALIVIVGFYFAARGGLLGKQLKKIAVEMVKEKPPEKPKEPEKPKVEPPKVETPKELPKVEAPKIVEAPKDTPPPVTAPPAVAPPAAELPAFDFAGGKAVENGNAVDIYKGLIQYAFTAKWNRPEDEEDAKFVAEVQVSIDRAGDISNPQWLKKSGDARWDNSVRQALTAVTKIDHAPPTNFPPRIIIRFDVAQQTESAIQ